MIGEVVGSYRIVAELGAGGMGSVFLAEHTMLGSKAAIKMLRAELSQQTHVVQRFFDEARAATRVADPGIVTVLDFGWHRDGSAFLVMEHLPGETLTRRVRRQGFLPPAQAMGLLRQCAMAMSAAHARGIVHRDLKPDNIFVVPDPAVAGERIKVLDFGIAKLLGEGDASHGGTVTGMILGTPGYMSPEQCRGAGNVDHRTDIYALGCVAFFMVCGRPPFDAPTPGDLIAAHLVHAPPAPSSLLGGIPAPVDAVILKCLAKDAGARFQTMLELVAAIDDAAVGSIPPRGFAAGTNVARGAGIAAPVSPGAPTVATGPAHGEPVAAMPTTLGTSVGQSIENEPRPRRGGVIGIALAMVAAAVLVIVVTTRGGKRTSKGAAGDDAVDAAPIAETADAAPTAGKPDAAPIVAAPPDAATRTVDRGDRGDHGDRGGHKVGAGSAKGSGGGSASAQGSGSAASTGSAKGAGSAKGSGSAKPHTGSGSGSGYDPYDVR